MAWKQTWFRVLAAAALLWVVGSAVVTGAGVAESVQTMLFVSRSENELKDCSHLADLGREACDFENDKREGRVIRYGFAVSNLWTSAAIVFLPSVALLLVGGGVARARARAGTVPE